MDGQSGLFLYSLLHFRIFWTLCLLFLKRGWGVVGLTRSKGGQSRLARSPQISANLFPHSQCCDHTVGTITWCDNATHIHCTAWSNGGCAGPLCSNHPGAQVWFCTHWIPTPTPCVASGPHTMVSLFSTYVSCQCPFQPAMSTSLGPQWYLPSPFLDLFWSITWNATPPSVSFPQKAKVISSTPVNRPPCKRPLQTCSRSLSMAMAFIFSWCWVSSLSSLTVALYFLLLSCCLCPKPQPLVWC